MAVVLRHVPEMVDRWLEGYHDLTMDFRRRVCLAETAFLSLCEVLLAQDPPRGVSLWRALSATMTTRYIGGAGTVNCCTSYFAFLIQRRSLNFATKLSAYLSATRIRSSLTLPSPLRTMESLLGSPQPQARIRTHLWLGDDGAAFCLQASAPDILFPSMTLGLRTRYGRTLLHFAKQLRACVGANPALITGGVRISLLPIRRPPMPLGFCFYVPRMLARRYGSATNGRVKMRIAISLPSSLLVSNLTGQN